jgi:HK97 gp10 family phage protein
MAESGGTFTLSGADELSRVFKQLPKKLGENAVLNAVRSGARVIRDEARRLAPFRTGALRRDIKVITLSKKARSSESLVRVGVKGATAFRAHFAEFGAQAFTLRKGPLAGRLIGARAAHPFLRPAVENKSAEAIRRIVETLGDQVGKQAAALIAGQPKLRKR